MIVDKQLNCIEGVIYDVGELGAKFSIGELDELLLLNEELKTSLGMRESPITVTNKTIRFINVGGSFSINDKQINVWPKFFGGADSAIEPGNGLSFAFREFLSYCRTIRPNMLHITDSLGKHNVFKNSIFIEYIADHYISTLLSAIGTLPISWYNRIDKESSYVRGRILMHKELSKLGVFNGKLWCSYSSFQKENNFSSLLSWACDYLAQNLKSGQKYTSLKKLQAQLGNAKCQLNTMLVANLQLPKQFNVYEKPFFIARQLYLGNHSGMYTHRHLTHGILLNMEKCFESFVSGVISKTTKNMGVAHRPQDRFPLARSRSGVISSYDVVPDDFIVDGDKKIIVDAKYKLIKDAKGKRKPAGADMYQIISACIACDTNRAALVYPLMENASTPDTEWEVINTVNGKTIELYMFSIDLVNRPADTRASIELQFSKMLNTMLCNNRPREREGALFYG